MKVKRGRPKPARKTPALVSEQLCPAGCLAPDLSAQWIVEGKGYFLEKQTNSYILSSFFNKKKKKDTERKPFQTRPLPKHSSWGSRVS